MTMEDTITVGMTMEDTIMVGMTTITSPPGAACLRMTMLPACPKLHLGLAYTL